MMAFMFCTGIITGVLLAALLVLAHDVWELGQETDEAVDFDAQLDEWWRQEQRRKRRESARWN